MNDCDFLLGFLGRHLSALHVLRPVPRLYQLGEFPRSDSTRGRKKETVYKTDSFPFLSTFHLPSFHFSPQRYLSIYLTTPTQSSTLGGQRASELNLPVDTRHRTNIPGHHHPSHLGTYLLYLPTYLPARLPAFYSPLLLKPFSPLHKYLPAHPTQALSQSTNLKNTIKKSFFPSAITNPSR